MAGCSGAMEEARHNCQPLNVPAGFGGPQVPSLIAALLKWRRRAPAGRNAADYSSSPASHFVHLPLPTPFQAESVPLPEVCSAGRQAFTPPGGSGIRMVFATEKLGGWTERSRGRWPTQATACSSSCSLHLPLGHSGGHQHLASLLAARRQHLAAGGGGHARAEAAHTGPLPAERGGQGSSLEQCNRELRLARGWAGLGKQTRARLGRQPSPPVIDRQLLPSPCSCLCIQPIAAHQPCRCFLPLLPVCLLLALLARLLPAGAVHRDAQALLVVALHQQPAAAALAQPLRRAQHHLCSNQLTAQAGRQAGTRLVGHNPVQAGVPARCGTAYTSRPPAPPAHAPGVNARPHSRAKEAHRPFRSATGARKELWSCCGRLLVRRVASFCVRGMVTLHHKWPDVGFNARNGAAGGRNARAARNMHRPIGLPRGAPAGGRNSGAPEGTDCLHAGRLLVDAAVGAGGVFHVWQPASTTALLSGASKCVALQMRHVPCPSWLFYRRPGIAEVYLTRVPRESACSTSPLPRPQLFVLRLDSK